MKNQFLYQKFQWKSINLFSCSLYALISFIFLCLLACNSFSIFCTHVSLPARTPPEPRSFSPENVFGKSVSAQISSSVMKIKNPGENLKTHLPLLHKNQNLAVFTKRATKRRKRHKPDIKIAEVKGINFEVRVMEFFSSNLSDYSCKFRFFMTWISSLESFGAREFIAIDSLFKSHPNGCLIIVSKSMDSKNGMQILKPFLDKSLKVNAIAPDFDFLFENTPADVWYNQLMRGNVNPGEVSLGQNLSNLLRLGLLYRFGGIYLDTDFLVLKSFGKLRNVIGAQTIDLETRNWSRLNNAVMIFDQGHPLLYKFIEEFALTFDGNKWGHNGPYLVSRVVSRLSGRDEYNFTVLQPMAFYPVDWSKIGSFFEGPKSLNHSKWLIAKLRQIRSESFAVHLWNKQSRRFKIEKGSIIQHIMFSSCTFCNYSSAML